MGHTNVFQKTDRTEGQRDALLLVALGGLSYEDVTQALSIAYGTVCSRINRARATLRSALTDLDFGIEAARALPADPAKLRARLLNYLTRFDRKPLENPDLYLFTNASSLLLDRVVSDQVRAATYRILASLHGVRLIRDVGYGDGRTGEGVAMRQTTADYGTIDWELIIDREPACCRQARRSWYGRAAPTGGCGPVTGRSSRWSRTPGGTASR